MYDINIVKRAEIEYNEALEYYSFVGNKKIAEKFNSDFSQIINALKTNPYFEIKFKDFRTVPFNHFPSLIFFKVYENIKLVKIISIFHTSRDPQDYPN